MESLDNQIIVSIQCLAYNHAPYIRQCLDGIVMQKTKFRFEAIVHDDASTDGTQDIIREYEKKYPDIIKPIYQKENQYSKGIPGYITNLIAQQCKGKYIALCEGDDYWIDPLKLQKQVDILEKNDSVSLVYTAFKNVDDKGNDLYRENYDKFMKRSYSGNNLPELFNMNYILTCTVAYRKELLETREYKEGSKLDYGLFLAAASYGDFYYLTDKTASYRLNPNSLTATKNPIVAQGIFSSYKYYASLFLEGLPKVQSYEDELLCAKNILKQSRQHGFIHLELGILKKYEMLREGNILHYLYLYLKCLIKKQTI